jgi:hypothetical protein
MRHAKCSRFVAFVFGIWCTYFATGGSDTIIWLHLVNCRWIWFKVLLALNKITAAKLTLVTAAYKSTNCLTTSHFKYVEQSSVQEHNRMKFRGPSDTGIGFCRQCVTAVLTVFIPFNIPFSSITATKMRDRPEQLARHIKFWSRGGVPVAIGLGWIQNNFFFLFFLRASWKHVVMNSDWCTTSCSLV